MTPEQYFRHLHSVLLSLGIIEDFEVREEFIADNFRYQRLRFSLVHGNVTDHAFQADDGQEIPKGTQEYLPPTGEQLP